MIAAGAAGTAVPRRAAGVAALTVAFAELLPVVLIVSAARSGAIGSFDEWAFAAVVGAAGLAATAGAWWAARLLSLRCARDPAGDPSLVWAAIACGAGVLALAQALAPAVFWAAVGLDEDDQVQPRLVALSGWWALGQLVSVAAALGAGWLVAGRGRPGTRL